MGPGIYIYGITHTIFTMAIRAYSIEIDGHPVTMLDPLGLTRIELARYLISKFGDGRIGAIGELGDLQCKQTHSVKSTHHAMICRKP